MQRDSSARTGAKNTVAPGRIVIPRMRVLITGAGGYAGSQLVQSLCTDETIDVMATDVRFLAEQGRENRRVCDIRDRESVQELWSEYRPDAVVHLASVVNPGKGSSRQFEYEVDVGGTTNVLNASIQTHVERLIVTSSGAAYGYHKDSPRPLKETDSLRGNFEFPYSHHKRLVEELLADHKKNGLKPDLVIFRVGTILGQTTRNQITALFLRPRLPAVCGSDSPFVFIWDQDVMAAILHALKRERNSFVAPAGIYNLAGDGYLSIDEIAASLGKKVQRFPAWFLRFLFAVLRPLGLSRYGPEQVRFLQYRPVLDNGELKRTFGFLPQMTSAQVFDYYCKHNVFQKKT